MEIACLVSPLGRVRGARCGRARQGLGWSPRRSSQLWPRSCLRSIPLRDADGGRELVARAGREIFLPFGGSAPTGPLELSLPTQEDLPEIVELVHEAFDRAFVGGRTSEDAWNPLAPAWNAFRMGAERKEIAQGLRFRLSLAMQFPSLRRPVNQDNTVAVLARERRPARPGRGALRGYFELCVLPADGRRPEDLGDLPSAGDAEPAPYFSNLCVAQGCRRLGLGRAMLGLAEAVVARLWRDEWVYLHIDDYEPSRRLYASAGYEAVSPPSAEGVAHLRHRLALAAGGPAAHGEEAGEGPEAGAPGAEAGEAEPDAAAQGPRRGAELAQALGAAPEAELA